MRVQRSIEIAAPPEKIWPYLVEPEKILTWFTLLQKLEYSSEKHDGVGTRFCWVEKAHGSPIKMNFAITEWVENEQVAFCNTSSNATKWYEQRWTVVPTARGSRFTFIEELALPFGFIGKILGVLAHCREEFDVRRMLAKLKRLAEA